MNQKVTHLCFRHIVLLMSVAARANQHELWTIFLRPQHQRSIACRKVRHIVRLPILPQRELKSSSNAKARIIGPRAPAPLVRHATMRRRWVKVNAPAAMIDSIIERTAVPDGLIHQRRRSRVRKR